MEARDRRLPLDALTFQPDLATLVSLHVVVRSKSERYNDNKRYISSIDRRTTTNLTHP